MANEEQLRILKEEGVEAWNKWRKKNNQIIPNLSKANFREADLSKANLEKARLSLSDFTFAKLHEANLRNANLIKANLRDVALNKADLTGANLGLTVFRWANLNETRLINSNLYQSDLRHTNLCNTDLSEADLSKADLSKADLSKAKLSRAILDNANINEAKLTYADLEEANLRGVQALGADFTSANLTGACIQDWIINSKTNLEGVICDYIYLKEGQQERRPCDPNRNFKPGEFTKLFQIVLETVDIVFLDGIDWKAFLLSFKELQDEYGEENVGVQAIERKSGGTFVVRIEVPPEANKAEIESKAKQLYETKLQVLEAQYRLQLQAKDEQITIYRHHNTDLMNIIKLNASQLMSVEVKKTRILLLSANPRGTSTLRLDEEMREIKEGLRRSEHREKYKIDTAEAVRYRDISRAILDYKPNIVHFSGHGTGSQRRGPEPDRDRKLSPFPEDAAESEGLVFEDETGQAKLVDAEALAGLFQLFADQIECIVLNACYSEVQAQEIVQHINYVIGMSQAIGDRAAIEFAVGFYDALGAGRPVEFAYRLGCSVMRMAGIRENLTPQLLTKNHVE
jgi:uncharacterized protein YjbI with pentapeptide repeats